ncbi:MAG: YncE family protein, partial [Thermomicrobiales bacterium]
MSIDRMHLAAINRLDRFWESLLGNAEGVGEVEPNVASTVRRLYALDDVAGPDRAFVQGLELELIAAGRTSESGRTHRSAPTKDLFQGGEAAATVVVERPVGWSRKSLEVAAAVVLCLVVGVAAFGAWQLAGPTAEPSSAVPDVDGVALYVSDAAGQGVQPLDPLTLQDVPSSGDALVGVGTPEATTEGAGWPSAWLASGDGSTVVRVDYRIDMSAPPSVLTVTVLDGRTGDERTRFVHEGLYRGVYAPPLLSGDGSRLLIPNEYLYVHVPGTRAGFSVYDTADGRLVSTIELFGSGDRIDTDRFFVGPTGDRLYAFSVINLVTGGPFMGTPSPFEEPAATVETPLLESYDLASGGLVGGLELSALVQGHPSERFQMPAAALSPDGRQMAFV